LSKIRYTHHAFFTLTYGEQPNIPSVYFWHKVATHYNRFIQKLRRLHCSPVQAIRAIESHASGNPHIHVLARFSNPLTINNEKYFDRALYLKWKQLWQGGYLDCKTTRPGQELPIHYLLKYLSKHTTTYKTLWRNYYQCMQNSEPNVSSAKTSLNIISQQQESVQNAPTQSDTSANQIQEIEPATLKELSTLLFCKSFNIKSLSWTRNYFKFDFPSSAEQLKLT
jgi:hypothetical protein